MCKPHFFHHLGGPNIPLFLGKVLKKNLTPYEHTHLFIFWGLVSGSPTDQRQPKRNHVPRDICLLPSLSHCFLLAGADWGGGVASSGMPLIDPSLLSCFFKIVPVFYRHILALVLTGLGIYFYNVFVFNCRLPGWPRSRRKAGYKL